MDFNHNTVSRSRRSRSRRSRSSSSSSNSNNSTAYHPYGTLATKNNTSILSRSKNAVFKALTKKSGKNKKDPTEAWYGGSRKTRKNMRFRRTRRTSSKLN